MKKDKKTDLSPPQKWTQRFTPLNHPVWMSILFLLFIFAVFYVWKFIPKEAPTQTISFPSAETLPPDLQEKALSHSLASLQTSVDKLSERLATLEKGMTHDPLLQKLRGVTLVEGVLDGRLSLDTLKAYLEKVPDPWAKDLLPTLTSLKSISTYEELEAMLNTSVPSPSPSLWERFQKNIKSFIDIRKVDTVSSENFPQLKEVKQALLAHDLPKTLHLFEHLPPEEKTSLASWRAAVRDRLALEKALQTLLLELAKG